MQFIEKVKSGEPVDIDEFTSAKPKAAKTSPSKTPQEPKLKKSANTKIQQMKKGPQMSHPLLPYPQVVASKGSISFQVGKDQLTPFLFDYLSSSDMMPSFTVTQALALERLLVRNPDIPTPDQVRQF